MVERAWFFACESAVQVSIWPGKFQHQTTLKGRCCRSSPVLSFRSRLCPSLAPVSSMFSPWGLCPLFSSGAFCFEECPPASLLYS